jgi:hypothetical protein
MGWVNLPKGNRCAAFVGVIHNTDNPPGDRGGANNGAVNRQQMAMIPIGTMARHRSARGRIRN